ncbi:MAG: class I SAM-dependent methyltransferase [Candidatus Korobacteraceae bacterium]|jgi:SAM-dependent methyltransferase
MVDLKSSRDFWEEKAQENAPWYISSCRDYHNPDLTDFWTSGEKVWTLLKQTIGYTPKPTDAVVDIGCGIGRLIRAISPEVGHVYGFDIAKQMLEKAKGLELPNSTFLETEGNSLRPLQDNSCDLVLAYCVFQHLPSTDVLQQYLAEMVRVSRGMIAFTMSPYDWHVHLLPILRLRSWLREGDGPKGTYKREWTGIRPRKSQILSLSPIKLQHTSLTPDKWLFFGAIR